MPGCLFALLLSLQNLTSLNGRAVEPYKVEERVVEEGGGRKVIERIVYRNSGDGTRGQPEKIRIEERTNPDGSTNVETQSYRTDINGRFQLVEKSTTAASKQGDAIRATTTIQRASINGGLEVVERQERSGTQTPTALSDEVRTFRKDANGGFRESARVVTDRKQNGAKIVENVTEYQSATLDGRMQLSGQRVSTEVTGTDGSVTKQVEIYGIAQAGRPSTPGELKLREQQLIEQKVGSDKTVRETLSIRRPDLEGRVSGDFKPISSRTCQGKCSNQP